MWMPLAPAWRISTLRTTTPVLPLISSAWPEVAVIRRFSMTCPLADALIGPESFRVHAVGGQAPQSAAQLAHASPPAQTPSPHAAGVASPLTTTSSGLFVPSLEDAST